MLNKAKEGPFRRLCMASSKLYYALWSMMNSLVKGFLAKSALHSYLLLFYLRKREEGVLGFEKIV